MRSAFANRTKIAEETKDAVAEALTKRWPAMPAKAQSAIGDPPFTWASLRWEWATATEPERVKARQCRRGAAGLLTPAENAAG